MDNKYNHENILESITYYAHPIIKDRDPTSKDTHHISKGEKFAILIGTPWLNKKTENVFILNNINNGKANWKAYGQFTK